MLKQNNQLLRRVTALLMCVCLVMGNISVAGSDMIEITSDPVHLTATSRNAASEVSLKDYADLSHSLTADREGTQLPDVVEDGQSLFFQLAFDMTKQDGVYLLRKAYQDGLIGPDTTFTTDISFLNLLGSANYPTSYDDKDNIASDGGVNIFRWWVDESTGKICLRFYENMYTGEGDVSNTKVAFEGTLDASGRDDNGKLHFGVDGESVSLIARQDYTLAKAAGVPYFSTDASSYLVDYTVTLTLDQNMKLSASTDMYGAALTLVDTVVADGALEGILVGEPVITAPTDETATTTVVNNGTENTLTLSSPDGILNKGTYTIVYKMKVDSAAALAKLNGYTDAQKTNTVEVKENGASLKTPLTATATIAWDDVTDEQFKIDKNVFTEKGPHYKGVYMDEENEKYYVDFRVVVYLREPAATFTVTDRPDYALSFQTAPAAPTLEGVDYSEDFLNNDISTVELTALTGANAPTVTSTINADKHNVITVTAPAGQMLQPGAYHLRVPADITGAVASTLQKSYPQTYCNTAFLTSVDGQSTNENQYFKQPIPNRFEPNKGGGYEVDQEGKLMFYDGKPVIRWDVWFGWDFYNETTFADTLNGMNLLVNNDYPFEIHSFQDSKNFKETLVSLKNLTDTSYIDFNDAGNGFVFDNENLGNNSDNTPVKLYKLVYFSTPADVVDGDGYLTTGLTNSYTVTHTDPFGNGFGSGPITGESVPELTANGRLYVKKQHVIEVNDLITSWKITVENKNKIPFENFGHLEVLDVVPIDQGELGEVTVYYGVDRPITVYMTMPSNKSATLVEGVHYTIAKSHPDYVLGEEGKYGFAVVLDMDAVAELLKEKDVTWFNTIEVTSYLQNQRLPSGKNYRVHNDGSVDYSNQNVELYDYTNAYYDRGFSTKWKGVHPYEDNYNPNSPRRYYVANTDENGNAIGWQEFTGGYNHDPAIGDGLKEIVWRIFIGAREFGNDKEPITVTVTDTFSDNQMFPTYEGKKLKDLFLIRAEDNMDYIILPDSVVANGNSFTLTFTVPGGGWAANNKDQSKDIIIDYHTILKPEAIKDALDQAPDGSTSVIVPYNNTATIGWNGDSYTLPTETSSATFSTTMLDKTSSIITAVSEIEYSIIINENRLPLNGGQPLVLTDTLGAGKEGFLYRDDSIRLFNMDTGKVLTAGSAVTDSTYTITWATGETKGFTISVPDAKRLKLTYRVKPQVGIGETTSQLINSASLDGQISSHTQDSFKVNASNQEATYTPPEGTAAISIRKLEGGSSVQTMLPGAVFAAYPVMADGTLGEAENTWTTDANGRATLEFQRNGDKGYETVYCIKEVSAPAGYIASNEEWYFYFSTDSIQYAEGVKAIVDLLEANGKTVQQVMNQTVHQMNVENMPVTCDLRIRKTDAEGTDLEGAVFTLQDAKGNRMPAPTAGLDQGVYYYTFDDLKGGNYTLTEIQAPEGFCLGEVSSWNITLDSVNSSVTINWAEGTSDASKALAAAGAQATLTIINEPVEPAIFELPVTKTLDGAEETDTVFSFTLEAADSTQPMPGSAVITTADKAYTNGSTEVSFGPIAYTYDMVGNVYTYTVKENAVDESTGFLTCTDVYEVQVEVAWEDGQVVAKTNSILRNSEKCDEVEFINTYVPTTSLSGTKIWRDENDQDGMRPGSVTLNLLANDQPALDQDGNAITITVTGEGDEWEWSISDLPEFKDGEPIEYTVSEAAVTGYTASYSDDTLTITNTHTPEKTEATVKKVWEDAKNQDGKRPGTLTVTLSNGTEVVKTVTLNAENQWTATVSDLPKYAGGVEIAYTWTEGTMPEGYSLTGTATEGTVTTLTNTYNPETTSATVKKVWDDANNQDGKQPESLTVTLSNGTEVTLNAENNWEATVTGLPKYANGAEIAYTWTEGAMPEGYSLSNTSVEGTITTLTNTYSPETTTATVKKVWDDANNQDGKQPESLTVTLSNGTVVTLNAENNWEATVTGLPKYANGVEIVYTWTEGAMPEGYSLSNTNVEGTVTTLTNSYIPEVTEATIIKVWDDAEDQDGKRPETLSVTLSNGTEDVETVTLTEENEWTATVTNLPKYANGTEIVYTWTEGTMPEGYTLTDTATEGAVTTLTNTHIPEVTEATIIKVWDDAENQDGKRPETLSVTLSNGTEDVETVTLTEENEWTATVTNLPKYAAGKKIAYSWTEDELPEGYTLTDTATEGTVTTLTNTHTPEVVSISGQKTWVDLNDSSRKRPASITIRLYADDEEVAVQEVSADDNWSWSFIDLPKYQPDQVGHELTYTVKEDAVAGYVTEQDGYDFTNKLSVVAFQKLDEQTGKPLSGAGFALYEGRLTAPAGTALMTWMSDGTAKKLPGLTVGQTYTIFETKTPDGYTTMAPYVFTVQQTDTPDALRTLTASNRHVYRFRKLSSTTNELVIGAQMAIKQGNTVITSWTTTDANDGWVYVADKRFKAGVTYTLVELAAPEGYRLASPVRFTIDPKDGFLIVNGSDTNKSDVVMYDQPIPEATRTPEPTTLSFRITKRWEDHDNVLGLRPDSIVVNLFRKTNNEASFPETPYLTVTVNSNGTDEWTFTFSDLPRKDANGRLFTYMAQEEPVEGYVTTYLNNGRTIVNTIPEEDIPPTPTPTLPYVTPTPSPIPRMPSGVQFIDGQWVYVDEYGVPLGTVPQTGDDTNFALWGSAIALPMIVAALAAVEVRRRKRRMATDFTDEEE